MTKQTKFLSAIVLQVAIIFVVMLFKFLIVTSGTEILLGIRPVDPRDMLRGDYVSFTYNISTVEGVYTRGETIKQGDTVYVLLRRGGRLWTISQVTKSMPTDDTTFLIGFVDRVDDSNIPRGMTTKSSYDTTLHVTYGIEQYFIPEGKGTNLPTMGTGAVARVAVDERGNAVVKQLLVNDKPWP